MKKNNKVSIFLDDILYDKLKTVAELDGRKIQDEIRYMITTFYNRNFKRQEQATRNGTVTQEQFQAQVEYVIKQQKRYDELNQRFSEMIEVLEKREKKQNP